MSEWAIETVRLTRDYGNGRGIRDVDLKVRRGSVFGLVGRNGAGKSTLLRTLVGLQPADRGVARLLGLEMPKERVAILARTGFVDEDRSLYDDMTVGGLLRFAGSFHPTWDAGYAAGMLNDFGLREGDGVRGLSRGARAELALVIALAPKPDLLILDEPTSGLDVIVRHEFLEKFIGVACGGDATILLSSHVLEDVERVCDEVAFMESGRLLFQSEIESVRGAYREHRLRKGQPEAPFTLKEIFLAVVREGFRPAPTAEGAIA